MQFRCGSSSISAIGAESAAPVEWSSSDSRIVEVSANGSARAVANGTAIVCDEAGGVRTAATVTVVAAATPFTWSVERSGITDASLLGAWADDASSLAIVAGQAGTGLVEVHLATPSGTISLTRERGSIVELIQPGQPAQRIALPRRSLKDCLAEELRRLDPDEVFGDTVRSFEASANVQASVEDALFNGVDRWDDALVRVG